MDHGVAYQPEAMSPAHAQGPSAGRLSNLFSKSLRKASSSRELASSGGFGHTWQGGSAGRGLDDGGVHSSPSQATHDSLSPRMRSGALWGASSAAGRIAAGERGSQDKNDLYAQQDSNGAYIPYRGPISPRPQAGDDAHPSSSAAAYAREQSAAAAQGQGISALPSPEVGPSFSQGAFSHAWHGFPSSGHGSGTHRYGQRPDRGPQAWQTRSEYPGNTRGLGIEHAIARDNLPKTLKGGSGVGSVGKDASARPSYLTTPRGSNTGDAPNRSGNALLSPGREDFNGERVAMQMAVGLPVAYTHGGNTPKLPASPLNRSVALPGLPSLMRADYSQAEPPIRAVTRRDPHAVAFPASAPATQTKTDFGEAAGERTLDSAQLRRGASVSSGEGGSSGAASATFNRSTNTSMTSLRAPSSALPTASGKKSTESFSRGSHSATPERAHSAQSRTHARPRAVTTNSTAASSQRSLRNTSSASSSHPSPSVAPLRIRPRATDGGGPVARSQSQDTTPPQQGWYNNQPLLSPIAASTQSEASPSSRRETTSSARPEAVGPVPHGVSAAEAKRRYHLLQQLHLDELEAHAPDVTGILDADNGCERILMPRPRLISRQSADGWERHEATKHAAFERNRRAPQRSSRRTESHPDLRARDQAHARMASVIAKSDSSHRGHDERDVEDVADRPFFHHRMPPNAPEGPARHAQEPLGRVQRSPLETRRAFPGEPETPDLAQVIAEGKALEDDRERWRREFKRSIGGNEYARKRTKSRERERKLSAGPTPARSRRLTALWDDPQARPPMPSVHFNSFVQDDMALQSKSASAQKDLDLGPARQRTIRYARSSPQLRSDAFDGSTSPPSPTVPNSFTAIWRPCGRQADADVRRRQSSQTRPIDEAALEIEGDLSRAEKRSSLASSWLGRRTRAMSSSAASKRSSVPHREHHRVSSANLANQRRMRRSGSWDASIADEKRPPRHLQAGRRTSWRPESRERPSSRTAWQPTLVSDDPVVIGHSTSPGTTSFRFPGEPQRAPADASATTFGVALSNPRPTLDYSSARDGSAPMRQGAHATSPTYHRPNNSADLRAILDWTQKDSLDSSMTISSTRNTSSTEVPTAPKRSSSLRRKAAKAAISKPLPPVQREGQSSMEAFLNELAQPAEPGQSLSVPPWRVKSISKHGDAQVRPARALDEGAGTGAETQEAGQPAKGRFGTPFNSESNFVRAGLLATPRSPTSPQEFHTPELGTPFQAADTDASYFGTRSQSNPGESPIDRRDADEERDIPSHLRSSSSGMHGTELLATSANNASAAVPNRRLSHSTPSDSSHSARSMAPHELWTADDTTESFAELFVRRPQQNAQHQATLAPQAVHDRHRTVSSHSNKSQGAESGELDVVDFNRSSSGKSSRFPSTSGEKGRPSVASRTIDFSDAEPLPQTIDSVYSQEDNEQAPDELVDGSRRPPSLDSALSQSQGVSSLVSPRVWPNTPPREPHRR